MKISITGKIAAVAIPLALAGTFLAIGRAANDSATPASIGNGTIRSFVNLAGDGSPVSVGVEFSRGALDGLPAKANSHSRCHDVNGDGVHGHLECGGDFETILEIPPSAAKRADIPFRWVSINWNPEGHFPPAPPAYAVPHFDFHFYTWERERVEAIAPGKCGELVDCEAFKVASRTVAPEFLPPGHIDVGAVVPRMGNHLIDSRSPELQNPPAPFTSTFIYGAFDGELIFWEPMITRAFLTSTANTCREIRLPAKVRTPGYYPSEYCIRLNSATGSRSVSLEKFVRLGG